MQKVKKQLFIGKVHLIFNAFNNMTFFPGISTKQPWSGISIFKQQTSLRKKSELSCLAQVPDNCPECVLAFSVPWNSLAIFEAVKG